MLFLHKLCKRSLRARFLTGGLLMFLPLLVSSMVSLALFLNARTHTDATIEYVSEELSIIHSLQKKLLWVPKPANDYLLHGNLGLQQAFEVQAQVIADSFHHVRDSEKLTAKVKTIVHEAEILWHDVKEESRGILKRAYPLAQSESAVLMEALNSHVLGVVNVLNTAQQQVHDDISRNQDELNAIYREAILVSVLLLFVGLIVSTAVAVMLMYSIYKPVIALKKGAAEFYAGNLQHRIKIDYQDELAALSETFNDLAGQLLKREQVLQDQASIDGLTGIYNRREFEYRFKQILKTAERKSAPLSLLLLDIDHFKTINDSYGHPAGDAVLRNVAACLREIIRPCDVLARIGGEEFAVLIDDLGQEQSLDVAERMRQGIRDCVTLYDGQVMTVTTSIGISHYPDQGSNKEELIGVADKMLYRAKQGGRDQICEAGAT